MEFTVNKYYVHIEKTVHYVIPVDTYDDDAARDRVVSMMSHPSFTLDTFEDQVSYSGIVDITKEN